MTYDDVFKKCNVIFNFLLFLNVFNLLIMCFKFQVNINILSKISRLGVILLLPSPSVSSYVVGVNRVHSKYVGENRVRLIELIELSDNSQLRNIL